MVYKRTLGNPRKVSMDEPKTSRAKLIGTNESLQVGRLGLLVKGAVTLWNVSCNLSRHNSPKHSLTRTFFRPASRTLVQKFWLRDNILWLCGLVNQNGITWTVFWKPQSRKNVVTWQEFLNRGLKTTVREVGRKKCLSTDYLRRIVILAGPDFARDFFVPFRLIPPGFPRMIQTVQEINSTLFSSCAIISPIRA